MWQLLSVYFRSEWRQRCGCCRSFCFCFLPLEHRLWNGLTRTGSMWLPGYTPHTSVYIYMRTLVILTLKPSLNLLWNWPHNNDTELNIFHTNIESRVHTHTHTLARTQLINVPACVLVLLILYWDFSLKGFLSVCCLWPSSLLLSLLLSRSFILPFNSSDSVFLPPRFCLLVFLLFLYLLVPVLPTFRFSLFLWVSLFFSKTFVSGWCALQTPS